MTHISILIPQRDAGGHVARQLPDLLEAVSQTTCCYEVIVIDDASTAASLEPLHRTLAELPQVRLLRLTPACGLSAALTAGVAASKGEFVVSIPAGDPCCAALLQSLLEELARLDLVVGRPRRQGMRKALHRIARMPRWLLLGLEVRDPECLLWAARREAVEGLQLACGMYRYLATLVAVRGYRVGEITIASAGRSKRLTDGYPNPGDLFAAWWFKRRWRQYSRMVETAGPPRGGAGRDHCAKHARSESVERQRTRGRQKIA